MRLFVQNVNEDFTRDEVDLSAAFGLVLKCDNGAEFRIRLQDAENGLSIRAHDGNLIIKPEAGNAATLILEEFDAENR